MNYSTRVDIKEYIDFQSWEKIQGTLANVIKLPILTVDLKGNEILLTGELPDYSKLLSNIERGRNIINRGRLEAVNQVLENKDKVLLYYSHDGLLNIWVPIVIEDKTIGALGCISLLDGSNKKKVNFREITMNSDISAEDLKGAFDDIKPASPEEVKMYSSMLFITAKTIPELAKQKLESEKKISELEIVYKLNKMINSELELEKILDYLSDFIMESFNAKNCSIAIVYEGNIKSRHHHKKFDGIDEIENVVIDETLNSKIIGRIADAKSDFRLKSIMTDFDLKSIISFPLKVKKQAVGAIIIYLDSLRKIADKDCEFISLLADQLAIAIFNAQELSQAKESAMTDKLTGLYNRRYFTELLKESLIKGITQEKPLSIAMIDVDDFKKYNDKNGHVKGDELLTDIASILKNEARGIDVAGRYGGEELILIMPEVNGDTAFRILERIRKKIEETDFFGRAAQPKGKVTISSGLVTCMYNSISYEELIELVDKEMYKSKSTGKNKINCIVMVDKNLPKIDVNY
jgi:diguanylate cyclase (GGDEF)-like protein